VVNTNVGKRKENLDAIELMFFQTTSITKLFRLEKWLNQLKSIQLCPIGNEMYIEAYSKGRDMNESIRGFINNHTDQCPVCFAISCIKLAEFEKCHWTLDETRKMVLVRIADERRIIECLEVIAEGRSRRMKRA